MFKAKRLSTAVLYTGSINLIVGQVTFKKKKKK